MVLTRQRLVTGAMRQPLQFGLLSVVPVPDGPDHWVGGVMFETVNCAPAGGVSVPVCDPETGEWTEGVGYPKGLDANGTETGEAAPFAVFGWFTCSPVGYTPEERQDRAVEHLVSREEQRVEQAFWTGDLGNSPSLQDPGTTTLNAGTAVKPKVGIALLEEYVAVNYGGQGVIHVTRALASLLVTDGVAEVRNGRLVTNLGTPVVAGSGYPGTGPAGEAVTGLQSWAYVTPAMFGYRGPVLDSSNRPGDLLDRGTNTATAIAERVYLLGFDPCGVAAVLIDPTS